jgi:hypothetical protein
MREEVAAQHRRLDGLFGELRGALGRTRDAAARAVDDLEEALAVHFVQEDGLYYPPIASLRPEHRATVQRFAADHRRFLAALHEVAGAIEHGALPAAAAAFEAFAVEFARHEEAEEALLRSLQDGAGPFHQG